MAPAEPNPITSMAQVDGVGRRLVGPRYGSARTGDRDANRSAKLPDPERADEEFANRLLSVRRTPVPTEAACADDAANAAVAAKINMENFNATSSGRSSGPANPQRRHLNSIAGTFAPDRAYGNPKHLRGEFR